MKNKLLNVVVCILCACLLSGCMQSGQEEQENSTEVVRKSEGKAESVAVGEKLAVIEKDFGSYNIPNNWYEDTEFMDNAVSYIKDGTTLSEPFDCVVVYADVNVYTAEDHEVFRDAIVQQLPSQLPEGSELVGEGIYTEQGYHCYVFEIVYAENPYPEAGEEYHRKIAYIVGEKEHCMVEEIWFGEDAESHEVFQGILDSSVWNEE